MNETHDREAPAADEPEMIVVIDDDYAMRLSCEQILRKSGFQVETYEDGGRGLEAIARLRPSLVVVDLKMPGISGMEVIPRVHDTDPCIVTIVITGYATIGTAVEAMKAGAYDFLPKPFKPDELRLIVRRGLERRSLLLRAHRAEMERELLKRRFVTFVSHELKTPLAAIHQYLDVLRQVGDEQEVGINRAEWLDRCLCRTSEMQEIIDDWLTLARMESETLSRRRIGVDLGRIIPDILKTYEEMARARSISLCTELSDDSYLVEGDPNCLTVLLDNLIVNAIKYNRPGGEVVVSAESKDGEVTVSVADTGIGIPEECRERLFDEFFRVKDPACEAVTGTGLGLPICKRIVSEMGGCIEVESQVDVGSVFRVRLPARREQDGQNEHEERASES
ncbi:MAG: hybrid sensor histidine kinase/response regulator [Gemmatimonadales bacterium]|jgi:signal transduction histidine kinase